MGMGGNLRLAGKGVKGGLSGNSFCPEADTGPLCHGNFASAIDCGLAEFDPELTLGHKKQKCQDIVPILS